MSAVTRREHFNSVHRLHNATLSDERNKSAFGKCNNLNFHGRSYELEAKVIGLVNDNTGCVIDTKELSDLINMSILEKFDYKNLNSTVENITMVIYMTLRPLIDEKYELKIKLYETPRKIVEFNNYLNL